MLDAVANYEVGILQILLLDVVPIWEENVHNRPVFGTFQPKNKQRSGIEKYVTCGGIVGSVVVFKTK